jgi:hypothetical protein
MKVVVSYFLINVIHDCFQMQHGSESAKHSKPAKEDDDDEIDEEDEGDQGECAACGESYGKAPEAFWICCDLCEKWYHGKCVKITPARAEHIKQYKCPACNNKRART